MISVRRATNDDCKLLYEWRNHVDTRRFFFNSKEISYADHRNWFLKSLEDKSRVMLIIQDATDSLGTVRFDQVNENNHWEVDIYIDPREKGKGVGSQGLACALSYFNEQVCEAAVFVAKILPDNQASHNLFQKQGFKLKYLSYVLS